MAKENKEDLFVYKFDTPVTWEDKTYESLSFDFEGLTGEDFIKIEDEMTAQGKMAISPEFSSDFLIKMSVRACKEPIDDVFMQKLPITAFNKIRSRARSFLLR